MHDSFDRVFGNKDSAMFIFAHPDDAEIYAGGTIARLALAGKRVILVKMTLGNRGSRDEKVSLDKLAETRKTEDMAAANVLGVDATSNVYLELGDGEIEENLENIEKLAKLIRRFRPDILVTHNPEDVIIRHGQDVNWINHRDHMNTGKLATYAAYPYSRDLSFFPEHFTDPELKSHSVSEFLYVDYYNHPDVVGIEVTDQLQTKIDAIAAHSSQYSIEDAADSAEFFTAGLEPEKNFERFRYVVAD